MNQAPHAGALRYRAFISYSHRDKAWAEWLHRALETYRVPARLVGQRTAAGVVPRRLAPVFRDRDELASSGDLGREVNQALAQSANLIVVCSPAAAASRWVCEEVRAFRRLGRGERIFCLIVAGEPNAPAGKTADECLSSALCHPLQADGSPSDDAVEPIAADIRPGKDGKHNAKLKLIAGLLDLQFDQLRRRELQRRNRRLAAVTALALIVMATTTVLAIAAVIARNAAVAASQDAVRRQKQAEGLVDFMLGDLNDKLAQVGRLDILEAVDDRAMGYFQSLPSTDVTDQALAQRAKGLEKIGNVRLDQGHLSAAMASYQAAMKLAGPLADASPGDAPRQLAYAEIQAFIGMTYWRQGQLAAAQQAFAAAQAILQHAQRHGAANPDLQFELSMIDNNIGHVLEARGQLDAAATQYRNMLALCRKLVALQPGNADWAVQLGAAHNNLGKVALLGGDLAAAISQYAQDDRIETGLAARDPGNNDQRESMLTVRAILGRTLASTGEVEAGLRDLRQAVDLAAGLVKIDPSNTGFQNDLALYSTQLGRLQRLTGDLSAAHGSLARSLSVFQALVKQDPVNSEWQRKLAEARLEQAEQLRAGGHAGAALAPARAALRTLDVLRAKQPDDRATLLAAVSVRLVLGALTADPQRASQLRHEALDAVQAAHDQGSDPRLLALRAEAWLALGRKDMAQPAIRQLWGSGYRDPALVGVLGRARISYPANALFQQRLLATTGKAAR